MFNGRGVDGAALIFRNWYLTWACLCLSLSYGKSCFWRAHALGGQSSTDVDQGSLSVSFSPFGSLKQAQPKSTIESGPMFSEFPVFKAAGYKL